MLTNWLGLKRKWRHASNCRTPQNMEMHREKEKKKKKKMHTSWKRGENGTGWLYLWRISESMKVVLRRFDLSEFPPQFLASAFDFMYSNQHHVSIILSKRTEPNRKILKWINICPNWTVRLRTEQWRTSLKVNSCSIEFKVDDWGRDERRVKMRKSMRNAPRFINGQSAENHAG